MEAKIRFGRQHSYKKFLNLPQDPTAKAAEKEVAKAVKAKSKAVRCVRDPVLEPL